MKVEDFDASMLYYCYLGSEGDCFMQSSGCPIHTVAIVDMLHCTRCACTILHSRHTCTTRKARQVPHKE